MDIQYEPINLGFSTADAEKVALQFDGSDLSLRFTDWEEGPVEHCFRDVLCFKWDGEIDDSTLRDDVVYEVIESTWLARQAELAAVATADYSHFMLCFNACGVLDVVCRR